MVEDYCDRSWCLANSCETKGCAEARSGLGSVDMACVKDKKRTCPDDRTCCMAARDIPVERHICIDSVKAKKALECVEELVKFSRIKSAQWDISHDELDDILKRYGFM